MSAAWSRIRSMARSLIDKGPEFIGQVVGHAHQLQACEIIADLTAHLRSLKKPLDYYEFQRQLLVAEAEIDALNHGATGRSGAAAPGGAR